MYQMGAQHAFETLGLTKEAGRVSRVLLKPFELMGPRAAGGFMGTAPFLAPLGALTGGITGAATADKGERFRKAFHGALLGLGLGGLAAGTHGALRRHFSKIPTKLKTPRGSEFNPAAEEEFRQLFRESAGIAGLGGIGGGLLAAR